MDSGRSGWGAGVKERGDTIGFVSRGWEGAGDCNELGGGRSVRGRLGSANGFSLVDV